MSEQVKRYAERDIFALDVAGGYYSRHVQALTAEGLHAKSDIAAELAHRDHAIDALAAERDALRGALKNLLVMLPSKDQFIEDHKARIPAGFCYVRWLDIIEGHAALTPSAREGM